MVDVSFGLPVLPGKTPALKQLAMDTEGSRHKEWVESMRNAGVKRITIRLQQTPQGDIALLLIETNDPTRMFKTMASSKTPFDQWLNEKYKEIYGIDIAQMSQAPQPEVLVSWKA